MQHNPYQPPKADMEAVDIEAAPRPIAAWILEGILAIAIALVLVGVVRVAMDRDSFGSARGLAVLAIAIAIFAVLCATVVAAIVAIHRGYKFARWLGLAMIVGLAVIMLFRNDTTSYANVAERSGGVLVRMVLMPALMLWWSYAFGLSRKASRYFTRPFR